MYLSCGTRGDMTKPNTNSSVETNDAKIPHTVSVDDKELIFLSSHRTLLECAEASDVEIHYHCRDGFCGACRTTLVKGSVEYPNGEPLAYVGPNEILPCCCVPSSDITIELE